jgi:hypothetical protein
MEMGLRQTAGHVRQNVIKSDISHQFYSVFTWVTLYVNVNNNTRKDTDRS